MVSAPDRGREASAALWQYCHWFRAALGIVDGVAVLPITAPPTSRPRSLDRSSAVASSRSWCMARLRSVTRSPRGLGDRGWGIRRGSYWQYCHRLTMPNAARSQWQYCS
jgi:hypothetical protein